MADVPNAPVQPPQGSGTPVSEAKSTAGFLATTTGKVVVGVVALLVLMGIAGAILVVFASGLLNSGTTATTLTTTNSSVGAVAPVGAIAVVNPPEKPLQSTFTFRNIFAPSVKPAIVPTEPVAAATAAETPAEVVPSTDVTSATAAPVTTTLKLNEIVAVGDAYKGVFIWNGATYTAGNDETIGSSPWKVIAVSTPALAYADMLYGDAPERITVGQSISK